MGRSGGGALDLGATTGQHQQRDDQSEPRTTVTRIKKMKNNDNNGKPETAITTTASWTKTKTTICQNGKQLNKEDWRQPPRSTDRGAAPALGATIKKQLQTTTGERHHWQRCEQRQTMQWFNPNALRSYVCFLLMGRSKRVPHARL